jgi:catechol-2,3-dioxygenase
MGEVVALAEVVLNVKNLDASMRFYRDTLGLEVIGTPPGKPAPVFLKAGEPQVGVPQMVVLVPLPQDSGSFARPRTLHHLALEVPEERFEETKARLEKEGFSLRSGEHPVIRSWTIYLDDPDGNEVEIIAKRTG